MFITFEGVEGCGKSTQLSLLAEYLRNRGENPLSTREPGGSRLGRRVRAMLLDCRQSPVGPEAELYLFLADRAEHLAEVVRPALADGRPVLCDRYVDSTIAYQGYGRGMDLAKLRMVCDAVSGQCMPDVTLLLDVPVEVGLQRAGERNRAAGTVISEGRFDAESLEFHNHVRQGYLALAAECPERIKVIDANRDPDAVFASCLDAICATGAGHTD